MIEKSENNESQIEGFLWAKGSKNELKKYRLKPSWCQISMVFGVQGGLEKAGVWSIFGHLSSWLGCRTKMQQKNAKKSNSEVGGDLEVKVGGGRHRVGTWLGSCVDL